MSTQLCGEHEGRTNEDLEGSASSNCRLDTSFRKAFNSELKCHYISEITKLDWAYGGESEIHLKKWKAKEQDHPCQPKSGQAGGPRFKGFVFFDSALLKT